MISSARASEWGRRRDSSGSPSRKSRLIAAVIIAPWEPRQRSLGVALYLWPSPTSITLTATPDRGYRLNTMTEWKGGEEETEGTQSGGSLVGVEQTGRRKSVKDF